MSESIGAALRTGREQRKLTLAQVSEATRIRSHYLQALENGDLSAIPSAAQARGFLRIYAQFLELDLEALIPPPGAAAAPAASAAPTAASPVSPPPAAPVPESAGASPRSLLTSLRERLARFIAPTAPTTESGTAAQPAAEQDSEGKKKAAQ